MNKLNQKLSEVLDVEPIEFEILPAILKTPVEDDSEFVSSFLSTVYCEIGMINKVTTKRGVVHRLTKKGRKVLGE